MDIKLLEDLRSKLPFSQMSTPALIGIAVVIVMVAACAAGRIHGAVTASEFSVAEAASQPDSSIVEQQESEPSASTLFVHVSGAVQSPGLYELEEGSRVYDAVQAAGGFTQEAAADSTNLARVVSDGEQVIIASAAPENEEQSPSSDTAPALVTDSNNRVNINLADAAELQSLPGIGESTAQKIISDRQANGPFKSTEDLKRVSGIGDKKFESLAELICV